MTVVAIWYEPTENSLWAVTDSRISAPGQSGGVKVRTDSAAKLFSLPVVCFQFGDNPSVELPPFQATTYGFAFSGNPTLALMTFANSVALLQQLITVSGNGPPTLREVVCAVWSLAERFLTEARTNDSSYDSRFEWAVFGWCPRNCRYEIYHLDPLPAGQGPSFTLTETFPIDDTQIVAFGSGKQELLNEVERIRKCGDLHGRHGRYPKLAIESMLQSYSNPTVGGSVSIGIANQYRFQLYYWVSPIEIGKAQAKRTFNGIDLDNFPESFSHHVIGTHGMV